MDALAGFSAALLIESGRFENVGGKLATEVLPQIVPTLEQLALITVKMCCFQKLSTCAAWRLISLFHNIYHHAGKMNGEAKTLVVEPNLALIIALRRRLLRWYAEPLHDALDLADQSLDARQKQLLVFRKGLRLPAGRFGPS